MTNSKRNVKIYLLGILLPTSLIVGGFASAKKLDNIETFEKDKSNDIFEKQKVSQDIVTFGGDERYIRQRTDIMDILSNNKMDYLTHLDTGSNGQIKVGYADSVNEINAKQFDYTFNHLNYLFDTINPDYHFVTGRFSAKDSDIFIDFQNLWYASTSKNSVTCAITDLQYSNIHSSIIKGAKIHFNKNANLNSTALRYVMAHEMMHVLYGSYDVDEMESQTFSLYNYGDVQYVVGQISNAYESVEDYKNGKINNSTQNYGGLVSIVDENGNVFNNSNYPILSADEKASFVSLLPTDVSTLIAIYGDSSTQENKKAYVELLKEVLTDNKRIFDIKFNPSNQNSDVKEQPYYEDDFELPTF